MQRPAKGWASSPLKLRLRSRRFVVADESMRPTFLPGDRLWVDPRAYERLAPTVGDVVVVKDPEVTGRLLLKRVFEISLGPSGEPRVDVRGDESSRSRDSRQFGKIAPSLVVGKVWYRYAPMTRRGPIQNG